ncbi:MAG TPA: DUF3857 domain-containing protein [Ferruginibacter sp.]|nr:DUF3857 domain-containing protein [Ferruginibacter sp.]HMP20887.1 DUF3857 domain-containing protein [Ferruginibacter sp.]
MNTPAKLLAVLVLLFSVQIRTAAQDKLPIKFGKLSADDFNIQSRLIDSGTHAVVVADVGLSEFMTNTSSQSFSLLFRHKKRMKIISKNGFDIATVSIPLYIGSNGKEEKLEDFRAYTYNLVNGKVIETRLEKDNLFTEKVNKNWVVKKFTFPALQEGSILEYSYQIKSDFIFNLQPWEFQGKYPVLWSQYDANIPEFFKYVTLSQGYFPFFVNKSEQVESSFTFTKRKTEEEAYLDRGSGFNSGQSRTPIVSTFNLKGKIYYHTWIMKEVPALKEEPFTTTIKNAVAKIEFQLNQIAYPGTIAQNYMDSWEKVAEEMRNEEKFGSAISGANNWLNDELSVVAGGAATEIEKARKLYEYVRNNFTWNGESRLYLTTGLRDVYRNKSGSSADINLMLIAMLRNRGLNVNPVILSTRQHGFTHEIYPLMDRYNYVIAALHIGNEIIYLDATHPRMPFGKLPLYVYNGHAREITTQTAAPLTFMADDIIEKTSTTVYVVNMDNGKTEGSYSQQKGIYQSMQLRNKLLKTTLPDYQKEIAAQWPDDIEITLLEVDSLKKTEEPILVKIELNLKAFENKDDIVYFSPMLDATINKNPFTAAERFYPVEMPYTFEDIYSLTMQVPTGYKIEELPKSERLNFNEDEALFEYLISASGTDINLRCRLQFNKANFDNEDYQSLRDFYAYIIKKQAEQIVFKKIK